MPNDFYREIGRALEMFKTEPDGTLDPFQLATRLQERYSLSERAAIELVNSHENDRNPGRAWGERQVLDALFPSRPAKPRDNPFGLDTSEPYDPFKRDDE